MLLSPPYFILSMQEIEPSTPQTHTALLSSNGAMTVVTHMLSYMHLQFFANKTDSNKSVLLQFPKPKEQCLHTPRVDPHTFIRVDIDKWSPQGRIDKLRPLPPVVLLSLAPSQLFINLLLLPVARLKNILFQTWSLMHSQLLWPPYLFQLPSFFHSPGREHHQRKIWTWGLNFGIFAPGKLSIRTAIVYTGSSNVGTNWDAVWHSQKYVMSVYIQSQTTSKNVFVSASWRCIFHSIKHLPLCAPAEDIVCPWPQSEDESCGRAFNFLGCSLGQNIITPSDRHTRSREGPDRMGNVSLGTVKQAISYPSHQSLIIGVRRRENFFLMV